jgi:hypothetical protein
MVVCGIRLTIGRIMSIGKTAKICIEGEWIEIREYCSFAHEIKSYHLCIGKTEKIISELQLSALISLLQDIRGTLDVSANIVDRTKG